MATHTMKKIKRNRRDTWGINVHSFVGHLYKTLSRTPKFLNSILDSASAHKKRHMKRKKR